MNEQFQEYLMGIIQKTGEFLGAEIPEVAQQILLFNMSKSILIIVVLCCMSVFMCTFLKIVVFKEEDRWSEDGRIFMSALTGCVCVCSVGMVLAQTLILFKIWLAPKLYLLEYAASLVK